jgi:hypothetical protein
MKDVFEYHRKQIEKSNKKLNVIGLMMLNNLTEQQAKDLYNEYHKNEKKKKWVISFKDFKEAE